MSQNKRAELIRKALLLFYRNGFHATGMDLVAKETRVSKTSIYKHFRTKDELILAVLRLRDENFRNWLFRRMEEHADTPQGQLLAMFDALEEWFLEDGFQGDIQHIIESVNENFNAGGHAWTKPGIGFLQEYLNLKIFDAGRQIAIGRC